MPSESPLPMPPGAMPPDLGMDYDDKVNSRDSRMLGSSATAGKDDRDIGMGMEMGVDEDEEAERMGPVHVHESTCEISEGEDRIVEVARSLSRVSREHSRGVNTFLDPTSRPDLDPHSERFSAKRWVSNMLDVCSRDPERYPRRSAGVSFRNLNVFGYGSAVDYQTNVGNMWLKGVGWLQRTFGRDRKVRIDILRNFEGFVRSGEMLVVLGRPGRFVLSIRSPNFYSCTGTNKTVAARRSSKQSLVKLMASGLMRAVISSIKASRGTTCTVDFAVKSSTRLRRRLTSRS